MASFEVCHVSAHKCNPASKVLRSGDAKLFTLHFDVYKKDALYFSGLQAKMQNRAREVSPGLA
jgi:hypothetical protein